MLLPLGDGTQAVAKPVPVNRRVCLFDFFVGVLPCGKGAGEQAASFICKGKDAAAAIVGVLLDFHKASPLQRLERRCESGAVHCEKRSHGAHGGRLGAIQRHEKRKLPVGYAERPECLVETPGQNSGCALRVEAETMVSHHDRRLKGQHWIFP